MNIEGLDLNLLKVFDAIWATKSVSKGAESIGLSQPAMSAALIKLRKQFDDPLFVRTANGMQPTPRALQIAPPIAIILNTVKDELIVSPSFLPDSANRVFVLALSDIGEMVFLPKLLNYLHHHAPGVSLQAVNPAPAEIHEGLEAGQIDLAVGYFPDLTQGCYQQRLFGHSFVTIARADHPLLGDSLTVDDFVALPHAVVSSPGRSQEVFDHYLKEQGIERRVQLRVPHFLSIPFIVTSTNLLVTVPRAVGQSFAQVSNIKLFDPPFLSPTFELKQHWHERYHQDPANLWLRQQIYTIFHERLDAQGAPIEADPWR